MTQARTFRDVLRHYGFGIPGLPSSWESPSNPSQYFSTDFFYVSFLPFEPDVLLDFILLLLPRYLLTSSHLVILLFII